MDGRKGLNLKVDEMRSKSGDNCDNNRLKRNSSTSLTYAAIRNLGSVHCAWRTCAYNIWRPHVLQQVRFLPKQT